MPPSLALLMWLILLVALLLWDPARAPRTSLALWVPVTQFFISGSRLPSMWLPANSALSAETLENGNSLDRMVYLALIGLAVAVMVSRASRWRGAFARHLPLLALLGFGLLSVLWSDFPFVAFKRWVRDIGIYLGLLVVLTDPFPLEAVRTVVRRLCFLLIPLSILLCKYYPSLGTNHDSWSGQQFWVGAATSKNMLGLLCLVSGLFFVWDTVSRWASRGASPTRWIIRVDVAFVVMTLYLILHADSATASVCLALGCLMIVAAQSDRGRRHPVLLSTLVPSTMALYFLAVLLFGSEVSQTMTSIVGRDSTFTGRTDIWRILLGMGTNALVGTGYESFWLGSRARLVWGSGVGTITSAHNGYVHVYLNLGLIGLCLLAAFLYRCHATIRDALRSSATVGPFALALWSVLVVYNLTEAAFLGGVVWMMLIVATGLPEEPSASSCHHSQGFRSGEPATEGDTGSGKEKTRRFRSSPATFSKSRSRDRA